MKIYIITLLSFYCFVSNGQSGQTMHGTIIDQESQLPLIGVNISIRIDSSTTIGTSSDLDGKYKITNVPLGRREIQSRMLDTNQLSLPISSLFLPKK